MIGNTTREQQTNMPNNLGNFLPVSALRYQEMQREITHVALLKKIIPSLTVMVFIALVLWPLLNTKEGSFTLAIDRLDEKDANAKLIKPRYVGIDKNNHPVNISAETAFRKSNDDQDYYLKNLIADMEMSDGTGIKVQATNGRFNARDQEIIMDRSVTISTENNFNVSTSHALFHIFTKIATGDHGITGDMPFGSFRADKFNVDVEHEIIRLKENVTLNFDPDKPLKFPVSTP